MFFSCLTLYQSWDVGGRETDSGHVEDVLESPVFYLSYLRLLELVISSPLQS